MHNCCYCYEFIIKIFMMPSLRGLISFDVPNKPRSHRDKLIAPLSLFRNVINLLRRVRATDYATRGWLGGAGGDERSAAGCSRSLSITRSNLKQTHVWAHALFTASSISLSLKSWSWESHVCARAMMHLSSRKRRSVSQMQFFFHLKSSFAALSPRVARCNVSAKNVEREINGYWLLFSELVSLGKVKRQ